MISSRSARGGTANIAKHSMQRVLSLQNNWLKLAITEKYPCS